MMHNLPPENVIEKSQATAANFETAISATGFGKYNFLLILILIPAGWASSIESSTMSYVFPAAQCDLDLTLQDKGVLNAITYTGMISSALIWGFLFDTLGRRKLLMLGFFLDFVCVFVSAFSQNKGMLMASKFFGGFIINGPYAALSTYISEFHSSSNRGRMQLLIAIIFSLGGIVLPWVAYATLSNNINFSLGESLKFHSWNILLLFCSLPPLVSSIVFIFMPESPKFLMTIGKNPKAMALFKRIYSLNTNKKQDTYPIKQLLDEIKLTEVNPNTHGGQVTANRSQRTALREGWQQIKPLFFKPYLPLLLLVCLLQALFTMNVNTLRLWLPQIFQALNDYQFYNNGSSTDICTGLEMIRSPNSTEECSFNLDNTSVYINTTIVSVVTIACELVAAFFINTIPRKFLLCMSAKILTILHFFVGILGTLGGASIFTLYFATSTTFAVALSSIYTGISGAGANVVVVVTIHLFPTTLRTISVACALMCGRLGSVIGNLTFPILVEAGCAPPFFTIGSLAIAGAALSLLLPKNDHKNFH